MKRIFPTHTVLLTTGFVLAGVATTKANLLTNGSFESPVGAPGLNSVRPSGWSGYASFVNGLVNYSGPFVAGTFYPAPFDGNQYVDIGPGELVAPFTVTTPGDYVLKWHDNSYITGWNGSYGVVIQDSSLANVINTAYSYSYLTPSPPWRELSLDLPGLAAGTYTLKFGPGTSATFLDDVSVDLKASVATPEGGSTASLLGIALLGVTALAKRRGSR